MLLRSNKGKKTAAKRRSFRKRGKRSAKRLTARKKLRLIRGKSVRARRKRRAGRRKLRKWKKGAFKRLRARRKRKAIGRPSSKLQVPSASDPLVSIIIPVHNKWEFTYPCLVSIVNHTSDIPYEIIVVDDVSDDLTSRIGHFVDRVTVIRNEVKKGFLQNCNDAAGRARGKYVLFLNNDTRVTPGWLGSMLALAENDPQIGIVGGKLVFPDGRLQEAGSIMFKNGTAFNYGRLDDPDKHEYNYVKEVDYISGASLMIRKHLWDAIGGFDGRYAPAYSEDADLAFEARKRGFKVVFQPRSVVVHYEGISHGTDVNSGIKSYQVVNQEKFREKWAETLDAEYFSDGERMFNNRDRSRGKKTILVIDYGVPSFDKDAGSKTTYLYLKLLVSMGYNVKFLPDNFAKADPYGSELEQLGVEVLYGTPDRNYYEHWIASNKEHIDFVLLNRPDISQKYVSLIKQHTQAKVLYYGHDLHFVRELRRYGLEKNRDLLAIADSFKQIEFDMFTRADCVLTCSEAEKGLIDGNFPSKPVVTIPAYYFEQTFEHRSPWSQRSGLLFVGGFNHTPNADGILWFCRDIFPLVQQANPGIKLTIAGSNPPPDVLALQSGSIDVKGYVSDEELAALYNSVRIAVIPMRYGAGVKGKTVEAMRYQVPIVSTDIGIEGMTNIRSIIDPKNSGQEFADEISRMYHDDGLLEYRAIQYKSYIETYFSRERALESLQFALQL